ncbi:MAG: radical SAM protein [Desulfotalea sp.]
MLLIQPPFTKPCEPSAALAQLTAHLKGHGLKCYPYDLNIDCFHHLLEKPITVNDTWSKRAFKNKTQNIEKLHNIETYKKLPRYTKAINDLNRLLSLAGKEYDLAISMANYLDHNLSPSSSEDLINAASNYKKNIFYEVYQEKIPSLINEQKVNYIGISINFLSQALPAFALIGYIKDNFPQLPIIVGGGLVSTWLKSPHWQNNFSNLIDHLIVGPGEEPLVKILGHEKQDCSALPDHEQLKHNNYLSPGYILPYAASIGCYWRKCSFCPEKSENNPYICLSEKQVLGDLNSLIKSTNPKLIHFLDSAISPRLMKEIAKSPIGVPWYGFTRISNQLTDINFVRSLKESGCKMLKIGLESGSEKVLQEMQKGISLDLASNVLKTLHRAGIGTYVYLLFGTPEETEAEAEKTMQFTIEHADYIDFLNLSIFNMPICGEEANKYQTVRHNDGDLSVYVDFIHPTGWDRKKVRDFLENKFKKNEKIAKIMQQNPQYFTSNHAPFTM